MSGWEDVYPHKLEEFPDTKRPTPQQISDAMVRGHKARREILPPADEFVDAPIDPRLMAWMTKWEWNRVRHLEAREDDRGVPALRDGERVEVDRTRDDHPSKYRRESTASRWRRSSAKSELPPLGLPQHPDEHRPERPVLLAVDQELGESPVHESSTCMRL